MAASHLRIHELHNTCMPCTEIRWCKPALTERVWLTFIATATACALSDYPSTTAAHGAGKSDHLGNLAEGRNCVFASEYYTATERL